MSPFLSPWLHSLLVCTLSLFFSCFFVFSFLVVLFFVTLLVFVAVLSRLVSLLLFHDNNNIKILDVKGFFSSIFSVSFGFPVSLCLSNPFFLSLFSLFSSVCFGEDECFHLSKKTISKTPIFVLHFVKHNRFYWGPFCRQNMVDV